MIAGPKTAGKGTKPVKNKNDERNKLIFKNDTNPTTVLQAAERLVIKKSLSGSSLFDLYRKNQSPNSKTIWQRVLAIKNLELTFERNNDKSVAIALHRAVKYMFLENLLFPFSHEYADKLAQVNYQNDWKNLPESFMVVFTLNGEIPRNWKSFKSKNEFVSMATKILETKTLTNSTVLSALQLVDPNLVELNLDENKTELDFINLKTAGQKKGIIILNALNKSAAGVETSPKDLQHALILFLQAGEQKLAKSILIEYLIYFSGIKT